MPSLGMEVVPTPEVVAAEVQKQIQFPDDASNPEACQLVQDYECTDESIRFKEMLSKYEPVDDMAVSKWLGSVVNNGEAHNIDVLVEMVNELAPGTNWVHVMKNLDHEGFNIPDESAFNSLMSIYARACKELFPLNAVCGSLWTNIDGQISFLKHAVSATADIFTFSHCSNQLAFPDLASLSPGNHAWYCLDLLKVLCQLAEVRDDDLSVPLMLEDPLEHCPELLLVGLGHVRTEHNLLQQDVMSRLFSIVLKDTAKSNVVKHLWNINPSLTLRGFVDAYSDPTSLMRIVDLCIDLKILSDVLDSASFAFNIKFAAAASRKYHSHVRKWLSEKSVVYKGRFLEECVNFVKEILSSTPIEQPQAMNLYWGSFLLFVEVCQSCSEELVPAQILDKNSTAPFDTICNKLEEQVRKMTLKHLFQPNCLDVVNHHINKLIKGCHSPKGLITEEEEEYSKLKVQTKKYPYPCIGRDLFEIEYGPVIMNLKTLANSNDKTLKKMEKGLLHFFKGDGLLHRVIGIFRRNKKASKRAGAIMCEYYDYLDRFDNEISWLHGAGEQIEQIQGLLSGSPVLPELAELRAQGRDLKTRVLVLQKERPQNFKAHCEALDALANRWVDIDILSKKLISLTETAKDLCLRSKNLRILMIEKFKYADRFFSSEERLKIEGSKVCEELHDLMLEVEQAELSFNKKMNGLPQVGHTEMKYEQIILGKSKSWITRLLKGRHILGEMRIQGRDMCAFVSTVVMTESLNKSEAARRRVYSGLRFRLKEFGIKLSEHHLQDIVREYYANNKRTGRQKMNVCLERMIESGVVSETAYGTPDAAAMDSTRYHLSEFETLETGEFAKAFHKLDDAKVLVGIFGITKGYHSLGPHDIYDVPPNAFLETNAAGNKLTHAVVLVGYGVSPEGEAYYDYQNWNGPDWGKGGCGKVTCRSIQKMYSAKL